MTRDSERITLSQLRPKNHDFLVAASILVPSALMILISVNYELYYGLSELFTLVITGLVFKFLSKNKSILEGLRYSLLTTTFIFGFLSFWYFYTGLDNLISLITVGEFVFIFLNLLGIYSLINLWNRKNLKISAIVAVLATLLIFVLDYFVILYFWAIFAFVFNMFSLLLSAYALLSLADRKPVKEGLEWVGLILIIIGVFSILEHTAITYLTHSLIPPLFAILGENFVGLVNLIAGLLLISYKLLYEKEFELNRLDYSF